MEVSEIIQTIVPYYNKKGKPESEHTLVYESSSETLEPLYFFILDLMNDFGLNPEKLIDNFSASPGGGYFAEIGQRATIMQQQASKILADIGIVARGILNIIYDLKEFRIRLQSYDDLKNEKTKESALLSLKQIWMDKVDIVKGNSSIKAMALGQAGFQTLIDAFLVVNSIKDVEKIDLNDRVKRILISRIEEFNIWLQRSEEELRKRYELEKTYLRSQVNNLKLYSRWAKPYLKTAAELEMKEKTREPALVKAFNTSIMELTLLGKRSIDVKDAAIEGSLPKEFQKDKFVRTLKRPYFQCVLVDFTFRGIPSRLQSQASHYVFGGRAEVNFKSYALNEDEINKISKEVDKDSFGEVLRLIEGTTGETLTAMQKEIDFFLEEKSEEKAKQEEENKNNTNPFLALFGYYNKKEEKAEEKPNEEEKPLKPDSWIEEKHLRPLAVQGAKEIAFNIFDIYKKAHGMASFDIYKTK